MKSGERLVRCLCGQPVDRVPFGVGLGWCPWGETLERWKTESGNPDLDVARDLGYESSFALPSLESGPFPHFACEVLENTGDTVVSRDWRGITMRTYRGAQSMPEYLDYPVKGPADWEKLKEERYRLDTASLEQRVTQDWESFRSYLQRSGTAVQVGVFPWGIFGTARDLMGVEELLVAFYTEPGMVKDIMHHLTSLWIALWDRVAAKVKIDHIHIWEDMSGRQGSLISPAMIEEFMMPCYDRIAVFARAHGIPLISVDSDGDCRELVPVMMRHGVKVFFPFEVQAGCDIREYRKRHPELGIMGGLDKRALAGTRADVDAEVEKAAWMIRNGGRYIPGFDHLIPPDAKWENFKYAAERLRQVCNEQ